MSKRTWIIIIILLVGFFGFFLISDNPNKDVNNNADTSNTPPKKVVSDDYVFGSKENKIVVMEYLDFECPGCAGLEPTMRELREKYADKVTFVIRYFPLTSIHQNALGSARAAQAAGKQGKFMEMQQILFENQNVWKTPVTAGDAQKMFEEYAKRIGLNIEQYKKDFASSETLARINRDRSSGGKLGIQGTPSLFINGEKFTINDKADIEKAIQDAIDNNKTDPNQK